MNPTGKPAGKSTGPAALRTLSIDIGGTGLKASVLGPDGAMLTDRARVVTTYPLPPAELIRHLTELVKPLPTFDRVSVAFPGVVREGRVLSAPHFVTVKGPGSKIDPKLVQLWKDFDLGAAIVTAFAKPCRVMNDADMQGIDVMTGTGVELVITLGTGLGTAIFQNGRLGPRLEFSQHPFRKGETYNEQVGDAARKKVGNKNWNKRVAKAVATLDNLMFFDKVYIGGGNAASLKVDLGPKAVKIDPNAGILGGIKLWDHPPLLTAIEGRAWAFIQAVGLGAELSGRCMSEGGLALVL